MYLQITTIFVGYQLEQSEATTSKSKLSRLPDVEKMRHNPSADHGPADVTPPTNVTARKLTSLVPSVTSLLCTHPRDFTGTDTTTSQHSSAFPPHPHRALPHHSQQQTDASSPSPTLTGPSTASPRLPPLRWRTSLGRGRLVSFNPVTRTSTGGWGGGGGEGGRSLEAGG